MNVQPADIFDRTTILMQHLILDNKAVEPEYQSYLEEMERISPVTYCFIQLFAFNRAIWKLEEDIRAGKESKLGIEEVGQRALKIRDLNKRRIKLKNDVAQLLGGFQQVKLNHASE